MTELVSEDDFNKFIAAAGIVIIDFYATWCGPCRALSPVLDKVTRSLGVKLGKVNVDTAYALATTHKVAALPTLMLYRGGTLKATKVGGMSEQTLLAWIKDVKN